MKFLRRLWGGKTAEEKDLHGYYFYVRCARCGEVLRGRVDLQYELGPEYSPEGEVTGYFVRKTIIGSRRCFQPIEVEMHFDARKRLKERTIHGGEFVSREQWKGECVAPLQQSTASHQHGHSER